MPDTHANLIKQTISNTPSTTGDLTLSTASTGYVGLGASDDGLTYNVTIYASDSDTAAKEVRTGCVYTHSGTSLSRGTLEKSTTGSALDLTSSAVVMVTIPGSSARTWDAAALEHVTGTDANTTMVVNTLYVVDMSAWATADRTYTLPATASVGDRVGIMISAGDASHELLITANTGDTLNAISGGTEWSRVFITGETVIMRCVTADATWVVEYDGRIPQYSALGLTTDADGETSGVYALPTSLGGAWTDQGTRGAAVNTANGDIQVRRAGVYSVTAMCRAKDGNTDANYYAVRIGKNNAEYRTRQVFASGVQTTSAILSDPGVVLAASDTIQMYFTSQLGAIGARGVAGVSFISVVEVL